MNEQAINSIQQNDKAVSEAKLKELQNVLRLTENTITLISDGTYQGGHAPAIAEVLGYHNGFKAELVRLIEKLTPAKAVTEAEEVKTVEVIQ